MSDDYQERVRALSIEKALAIASYGESVAAYRYRTLSEHTTSGEHRKIFTEMAEEEQDHHRMVLELINKTFPESDFVLSPEDKDMVIVGPRLVDVGSPEAFACAMEQILASELLTGRFYDAVHAVTDRANLKPMLKEMAEECIEHAALLEKITTPPAHDS